MNSTRARPLGDAAVHQWLREAGDAPVRQWVNRVVAVLAAIAELAIPPAVGVAVAGAIQSGEGVGHWLPLVGAVTVAGVTAGVRTRLLTASSARELRALRLLVAQRLMALPARTVERIGTTESLDVFNRHTEALEPLLTAGRIRRRVTASTALAAVALMAAFEPRLFLGLVAVLAVSACIVGLALKGVKDTGSQALQAMSQASADLGDSLCAIRSVKVYGQGPTYAALLDTRLRHVARMETRLGSAQSVVDLTVKVTSMAALIVTAGLGAHLVAGGAASISRVGAFLAALAVMLGPTAQYADLAQARRRAEAALPRLAELAAQAPEDPSQDPARPTMELVTGSATLADPRHERPVSRQRVSIRPAPSVHLAQAVLWPDDDVRIGPIELTARAQQLTCLTGRSGLGKSTALAGLCGFVPLSSGHILVADHELSATASPDLRRLRRDIALVEQGAPFNGATVRDYLSGPGLQLDRVQPLLDRVGLGRGGRGLTLDTNLERGATDLSGGERQRLSLVRAFASDRPIVLLDEPTANLDAEAERSVISLILGELSGRVVLAATHSSILAAAADHVVELSEPTPSGEGCKELASTHMHMSLRSLA